MGRDIRGRRRFVEGKIEEAVKIEGVSRSLVEDPFVIVYRSNNIGDPYYTNLYKIYKWLFFSDFALSFGLFADLEIFGNIEMFHDI